MNIVQTQSELDKLEAYLRFDPENVRLLIQATDAALAERRLDSAEAYALKALQAGERSPVALQRYAHALMAKGNLADAVPILEEGHRHSGDDSFLQDLAYAYWRLGEHARIKALVEERSPKTLSPALLVTYLRALHALGELEPAAAIAAQACMPQDTDAALLGIAALIAFDQDDLPAAASLVGRIPAGTTLPLEAAVVVGYLAVDGNRLEESHRLFNYALSISPEDGRSLLGLGMAAFSAHDFVAAENYLKRSVHSMPEHLGSWHALGWCQFIQGNRTGATAIFEHALSLDRNFGESHGAMAVIAILAGDTEGARRFAETALRLDRHSASAQFAQLLLRGNPLEEGEVESLARRIVAVRRKR